MRKHFIPVIAAAVCILDRAVKVQYGEASGEIIPGLLRLTPVRNTGISFGMLAGGNTVMIFVILALIAGGMLILRRMQLRGLAPLSLALILGGAAGNLIDRVLYGYVIDMLDFAFVEFLVFNVADACVVCGAILCGVSLLFRAEDWRSQ